MINFDKTRLKEKYLIFSLITCYNFSFERFFENVLQIFRQKSMKHNLTNFYNLSILNCSFKKKNSLKYFDIYIKNSSNFQKN